MVIYFSQKICEITCTCSCIDVDCDMEHYTSQCLCIQNDKKKKSLPGINYKLEGMSKILYI